MAQTQTHTNAPAPVPNGGTETSADQVAWCKAAEARKYRVHDNQVWCFGSGLVVPVPAPRGFAAIEPLVAPFIFQGVMQQIRYRIMQNGDGDVTAKVAMLMANGQGTPNAQNNDAFEECYNEQIGALLEAKYGKHTHKDGVELKGDALKAAKAARDKLLVDSAARPANRDKYFTASVKAAADAARNVPVVGKKRTTKTTTTDSGDDL